MSIPTMTPDELSRRLWLAEPMCRSAHEFEAKRRELRSPFEAAPVDIRPAEFPRECPDHRAFLIRVLTLTLAFPANVSPNINFDMPFAFGDEEEE